MERIATATAEANKFGGGKNGFKDGSLAGGIVPTQFEAEWCDQVQEEIAAIIEGYGVALDAGNKHQASEALLKATAQIQPLTAAVAANALTITLNPTILDFRAAALSSGAVSKVLVPAAISLVISSGSTLGTVSGNASRLVVLAINNGGAVELAVVNQAGGLVLDETGVLSTSAEGGAGAADSASTVYSTAARADLPYRVVGFIDSTQAAAGTWATAPSTIQGAGGRAGQAPGLGSVPTDLTGSRALATTYYNTTGRIKHVSVTVLNTVEASSVAVNLSVKGVIVDAFTTVPVAGVGTVALTVKGLVPPGAAYSVAVTQASLSKWIEYLN